MSVGVVNKTTGDRIQTAGDPLDKVGNLANLTTSAKDNAVNAINEVNATKANQAQLATVEASTTASKAYSANDYLVLGGVLYKVTANIAQGGTIVTEGAGKNVDLATVGGELNAINSNLSGLGTLHDMVNQAQQDDFVGKYAIIGKICFFSLICTKSQASYTLGMIEGVLPVSNWVLVAYDSANSYSVYVASAGGNTGTLLQMSAGVLANKVAVSGCFLIQ